MDVLRVFVVAGEPSGDELGGRLMAALRDICGDKVRFAGVGGPAMEAQGLQSLFPMAELSVMGLLEVLPHVPRLLGRCDGELRPRRLPALRTAYPRSSKTFRDPDAGLASVEALYAASVLLGEPHPEWLADYRWRDEFLRLNPTLEPAPSP